MAQEATEQRAEAQIGVTGLAVMGRNLARNLARHGFTVAVHNRSPQRTRSLIAEHGTEGAFVPSESLPDFVASLQRPRAIIIMVKAGAPTDAVIDELVPLLDPGDIVVDAGNAYFADTRRREEALRPHGLHFVGTGLSGGEEGALHGPSIMPGGSAESYAKLGPIFEKIAAQVDGVSCCTHVGPDGAGHFVKMVHNGIEYGMMAAIAEGLSIIKHANVGKTEAAEGDAENTPLRNPEYYQYDIDVAEVAEVWRRGSVISSWLVDLTADALARSPGLDNFAGRVSDSGEGRWTVLAAVDEGVPAPVITASLVQRFESRGLGEFTAKVLSAMRSEFGGHAEQKS
ncbi:MAG TPA: decarboxylating 6-phosphogluconate dehydrogenase [Micromonosporaceae bacterium]|nr:decarboxylating 6-phosphogluconate dehydrogenase [Micromonosporaceae bacterium]